MKRVIIYLVAAAMMCGCAEEEKKGNIYGVITDIETGEPMRASGVMLINSDEEVITQTVTGNEGQYEFIDLKAGSYFLIVNVSGYEEIFLRVAVSSGKTTRADMQLENYNRGVTVSMIDVTDIGGNYATLRGNVTATLSSLPDHVHGFVYAMHANPNNGGVEVIGDIFSGDSWRRSFQKKITNLQKGTYYVQAYAKTVGGTVYSSVFSFEITGNP